VFHNVCSIAGVRLRLELFVDDLAVAEDFYTGVLGFEVVGRQPGYVSVRRGSVLFGLGPVAKLPADDDRPWPGPSAPAWAAGRGPGFSRRRLAEDRGAGVEIVLELDDLGQVAALHDRCLAADVVVDDLRQRPWGLWDFRVVDPDGYYLRVTH
jgi:catechol 2,3-dioxygenase-like lactoylglutathione lyase family enzyme